jgi:hypothetical protein
MLKDMKDMSLDEMVSWGCGTILIGIGDGKFRCAVSSVIVAMRSDAVARGYALGAASEKRKRRKAKK